jgi:hypothetical protein
VPYHWSFYVPLALLHLSIAVRLAGDLAEAVPLRATGAVLNAVAILAFVLSTVTAVARGRRTPRVRPAQA